MGDPACWLSRTCPACGLVLEDDLLAALPAPCPRCGEQVPAPDGG